MDQRQRLLVDDINSSLNIAGDKEIYSDSDDDELNLNRDKGGQSLKQIKPVSTMSVTNDYVRQVRDANGRPAPEPFEAPVLVDIVCWVPALYIGTSLGALIFISCFQNLLSNQSEECISDMRGWGIFLLVLTILGMIFSCTASCILCFDAFGRRRQVA